MSERTDRELIDECLGNNTRAFEELVERYQKQIFNGALKMVNSYQDAQDITQTAFIKAYERLANFDPKYKFFSWLYRIMVNESLNLINQRKSYTELDESYQSRDKSPADTLNQKKLSSEIEDALMELQPEHRVVLVLRHFGNLPYRDLAFVFDVPEKTVKSRLFTARQMLCKILMKRGITVRDCI